MVRPTAADNLEGTDTNTAVDWYKDAVIYELHVRAFADSDGDGIAASQLAVIRSQTQDEWASLRERDRGIDGIDIRKDNRAGTADLAPDSVDDARRVGQTIVGNCASQRSAIWKSNRLVRTSINRRRLIVGWQ